MSDTKSLKSKVIENLSFSDVVFKVIENSDQEDLQQFLGLFQEFFFLCEGVAPSAKSILEACPSLRNIEDDKVCLGLYQSGSLICFLDLVQHYPNRGTITI